VRLRRLSLAATAVLLSTQPAAAQGGGREDGQAWGTVLVQGSIKNDLLFWAEAQARFTDDASRLGQILIRPAIGVRLTKDVSAHLGYAYVRTDPETGAAIDEHRLWEQLIFPILRNRRGLFVWGRSRIEQRFFEGRADTGWRWRQFVRAQLPLRPGGRIAGVVFSEGFFAFNSTDFGARAGLDQWRNFIGVSLPVAKGVAIEPGYLNQTLFRSGQDRMNHIFNTTLSIRF